MNDDFETWFLANDGYIHPDVEIASDALAAKHLRVSDGRSLAADSLVVSCPHEIMISWLNVISGSETFLSQFLLEDSTSVNQVVIVRFFLLNEYLKREGSFWWPYIRSLLQPTEAHLLHTPLWYKDVDWVWIYGTSLERNARKQEQSWRQEYDVAMRSLDPSATSCTSEWSWDLYKWAGTIMNSRSFPSSALANSMCATNYQAPDVRLTRKPEDSIEPGSPVLIPGLDILNHRPFAKVTWQWGSFNCRLLSNEGIASGCQVYNNYGPKTNEELIMGYGFSLADNPVDHCILKAPSRSSIRNSACEATTADDSGQERAMDAVDPHKDSEPSAQWVRLYNDALDGCPDESARSAPYVFSPHFLHDTAVAISNRRERGMHDPRLADHVNFADPARSHSKLKVLCTVTMLLQKQYSDIVQYNANVPQSPDNEKQFHAARYRQAQLHILRTVNAALLDQLAGLAGLKTPECRDARVIRLEHTLTESPQPLLTDYRAVLNAGLGTRNPDKIKERGFTEHAFTLWVCGLWLWQSSMATDTEGKSTSGLAHGCLQWLKFAHEVYKGKPSDDRTATCLLCPGQSQASHTTRDKNGPSVAESLLNMVRAAVQKHPTSLYNHPGCTQERLAWCLDVVREESMMAPNLEGKSGEANDELLMFLDVGIQ